MSIAALALAQLLNQCAPAVGPRTMSSIVAVESVTPASLGPADAPILVPLGPSRELGQNDEAAIN